MLQLSVLRLARRHCGVLRTYGLVEDADDSCGRKSAGWQARGEQACGLPIFCDDASEAIVRGGLGWGNGSSGSLALGGRGNFVVCF